MKEKKDRFWEIDFLRGFAVIIMIIFHLLFDLNYFGIYKINMYSDISLVFVVYPFGCIFIGLVGVSLALSHSRIKNSLEPGQTQKKYLLRGLKIIGYGLLITVATWIYPRDGFVIFGVLHCIGLSIILAYPFLKLRWYNLIFGVVFVFLGAVLKTLSFDFQWLLWLGFKPRLFYTVDYYPLLPWFGVVLIGIFVGKTLYPNYKRKFKLMDFSKFRFVKMFCFLGRHSLIVYLIHQPILVGIIYLLF